MNEQQPWYRQMWPWILIAIPASAVVASAITLWLAITHEDPLVVDDSRYQAIRSELRAQTPQAEEQPEPPREDDG